jgi:farnesyl-diphosphate farnesyltransferase
MLYASKQATKLPNDPKLAFCYDMLNTVSRRWGSIDRRAHAPPRRSPPIHRPPPPPPRSFAVVIQQLPKELRDAICVFYLVLRGLDTVEDDMAIDPAVKIPDLLAFHKYIYER